MYEFSESEIKELKAKNFLDEDGHPSKEAYKHALSSGSYDCDTLIENMEKHAQDCPICGKRYKEASSEKIKAG